MPQRPPALRLFPSALVAEAAFLDHVDRLRGGPLSAGPVRVVVPSSSLRLHLTERLVSRFGAVLGIRVQTLAGLAAEVLRAAGERPGHADPLLPVLVARHGREQPALADVLGALDDGWQAAVPAVEALLDADFTADRDAVPLARLVAAEAGPAGDGDQAEAAHLRWLALIAVAGAVQRDLSALRLRRGADSLRAAATRLALRGPELLPARALCFYGSADLSAPELDLVDALVRHRDAALFVVAPPPLDDLVGGRGRAWPRAAGVQALRDRLGSSGDLAQGALASAPAAAAPRLVRRRAVGRTGEALDLARCVRAAIERGVRAERIGLVVRDPVSWVGLLRPELERLGVPFSGVGASAPAGPALRRLRAMLGLLREGPDASAERWLAALGRLAAAPAVALADLRTGLATLGCATLRQVADLDVQQRLAGAASFPLPVRTGIVAADDDPGDPSDDGEGDPAGALPRRRLPAFALAAAVAAARSFLALWADDAPRALQDHATQVRSVAEGALGWGAPEPAWRAMDAAVGGLTARVDAALELSRAEALVLLAPAIESAALGPVGGGGGGVQLLSAVEARGRTFDLLLVGGLVRGEFPRSPRPDPLLPERARRLLRTLLPDLSLDAPRRDVEQELVAHLLGAAPDVRLSWTGVDDQGKAVAPSPVVERLSLLLGDGDVWALPPPGGVADPPADVASLPQPPAAHLRAAGDADPPDLEAALALALGTDEPVARARVAFRDALDLSPGHGGPGPLLGLVGPAGADADPRHGALFVTTLEGVARCGWQTFLERVLRIEPAPDVTGALPEADARLVGMVVHAVLEQVARSAGLDQDLAAAPVHPAWPADDALVVLVADASRRVATEEGLGLDGMWRVLAARASPFLDVARRVEWGDGLGPPVVAVEHQDRVDLDTAAGPVSLRFRADRVDRGPDGALILTDYKTGGPVSRARKPDTRARHLLADVQAGRRLQGALYAQVADGAVGRYLSLRPDLGDLPDEVRDAPVPDDRDGVGAEAWHQALVQVVGTTLAAWRQGVLLPRLTTPDGTRVADACKHCRVRQACTQGDSTARRRLSTWASAPAEDGLDRLGLDRIGHAWWWLGEDPA